MDTRADEIAERIYRLSTFLPEVGPRGLTFNQFLVDADEPLLFHCGQRSLYPSVSRAVARIMDPRRLRWIAFSHIEADECGALAEWLAAAPQATVTHGAIGCAIWLNDQSPRAPRALADNEVIDLGGRRVRRLDTPHVPHCWDAGLLYEEVTGTLFTSDLFTHAGDPPALTEGDLVGPAMDAEKQFAFTAVTPSTGATIRRLAALRPRTPGRDARLVVQGRCRPGPPVAGRRLRGSAPEDRAAASRLRIAGPRRRRRGGLDDPSRRRGATSRSRRAGGAALTPAGGAC